VAIKGKAEGKRENAAKFRSELATFCLVPFAFCLIQALVHQPVRHTGSVAIPLPGSPGAHLEDAARDVTADVRYAEVWEGVMDQTVASWNQVKTWLERVVALS
jgi:hypothetical protein